MFFQLIPHIDGVSYVSKIALNAEVDVALVKLCILDLIYLRLVKIVPIFLYSNCYVPTPEVDRVRTDPKLRESFVAVSTRDKDNPVSFRDLYKIVCDFKHGTEVMDLICFHLLDKKLDVKIEAMIRFLLLHGLIRRVYRYPVWRSPAPGTATGQDNLTPPELRALMNGSRHEDEICCLAGINLPDLCRYVERDPQIIVFMK